MKNIFEGIRQHFGSISQVYWWTPDMKFKADGAIQMFFPDHNPGEWAQGIRVSQAPEEKLWQYYKPGIDSAAPKVFLVLSNMQLVRSSKLHAMHLL